MADHPLLPQAKLRELHALMQHCRTLDKKHRYALFAREGLLAATAMQLEAGDLLVSEPGDAVPAALDLPASKSPDAPPALRLGLAAGIAQGFRIAQTRRLVLVYARAGSVEREWEAALIWAQQLELPLLLVCAEVRGPGRKRQGEVLTWEGLSRLAQRLGLPVFPVDAEDPVAVYRVMYESVLRAREGGGPAVLWGDFDHRSRSLAPRSAQPLARLETYLRMRGINWKN